jgi:hypothetical protein
MECGCVKVRSYSESLGLGKDPADGCVRTEFERLAERFVDVEVSGGSASLCEVVGRVEVPSEVRGEGLHPRWPVRPSTAVERWAGWVGIVGERTETP